MAIANQVKLEPVYIDAEDLEKNDARATKFFHRFKAS